MSSAAGLVALPWHAAYSASKYGLRGLSEVLRFDLARHRIGVSVVVPGAVKTPLVQTVQIAGVDRDDPDVSRWMDRFAGHAVSPEHVADRILRGVASNRFLIYTSPDIRALYCSSGRVVALQRRDAAGQRGVHPGAAADAAVRRAQYPPLRADASSSRTPSSRTGPVEFELVEQLQRGVRDESAHRCSPTGACGSWSG